HFPTPGQCLGDGGSVDVFEIAPHGNATSEPGHPWPERPDFLLQVDRRGLALDAGVGRDDDLLDDTLPADALKESDHVQLFRPHSVQRREVAAEHVEDAAKLPGALDGTDLVGLFHDAQNATITARIRTDLAELVLSEAPALVAPANALRELHQRPRQVARLVLRRLHEVMHQPERGLAPDPR